MAFDRPHKVLYLPISTLSLAEYLYWRCHFLQIPFVVTSSTTDCFIYSCTLIEAGTLIVKPTLMVRQLLICCFSLNTAATPFNNCQLMWKIARIFSYIIIIWWIKCWRFCLKIANHQSLLLSNISSYMVYSVVYIIYVYHVVQITHRDKL